MLLALAAPAWQLLTEHRCGRPRSQNKVEAANNVITQSLRVGVHSLQQQRILGIVDSVLAEPRRNRMSRTKRRHLLRRADQPQLNVDEGKRHRWRPKV